MTGEFHEYVANPRKYRPLQRVISDDSHALAKRNRKNNNGITSERKPTVLLTGPALFVGPVEQVVMHYIFTPNFLMRILFKSLSEPIFFKASVASSAIRFC